MSCQGSYITSIITRKYYLSANPLAPEWASHLRSLRNISSTAKNPSPRTWRTYPMAPIFSRFSRRQLIRFALPCAKAQVDRVTMVQCRKRGRTSQDAFPRLTSRTQYSAMMQKTVCRKNRRIDVSRLKGAVARSHNLQSQLAGSSCGGQVHSHRNGVSTAHLFFLTLMPPDEKRQQEVWEKRQAQTPTRLNACCANFRASQVTK